MSATPAIVGEVLLEASGLTVRRGDSTLLDQVNLQIRAGEVLGVIGPNGAGKSTLLKVLAGVLQPDAGTLLLRQQPFSASAARSRARQLAYLEQRPQVQWPLTVAQVVLLGRLPHSSLPDASTRQALTAALAATDTAALAERAFNTLSEGEKLRVHLARVLATQPQLILADEPIAALDPWHQLQVLELLRSLAGQGLGIVVVLHDLTLAARYCQRLQLLDQGRTVAMGTPAEVLSSEHLASVYRVAAALSEDQQHVLLHGRLPD
jgi:iron complex transport system ATP-binding protein